LIYNAPLMKGGSSERVVVGFSGHIGAGKTSAARFLESSHGFRYLRYSQVLAEWLLDESQGKAELQAIGWDVMDGGRQRELNSRLIARIESGADHAIDGLRHPIDHESLSQAFPSHFFLLHIEAPLELRWQRHKPKGRFASFEEFRRADMHPVEQHIDELKPLATKVLTNTGALEELYQQLDAVLVGIRQGAVP
jgi:dephospho-CoA kinase